MPRTILKLKLVDPPADELERIAMLCRRGTNAAVEDWMLRHRGKPESGKQAKLSPRTGKSLHPSTKLYHAITAAVPEIGTATAASLASKVWSNLNAKVDWRERVGRTEGPPPKRKDAVLEYKARPPWTTALEIPAPNKFTTVRYGDEVTVAVEKITGPQSVLPLSISLKGVPAGIKKRLRGVADGTLKLSDSQIIPKRIRDGQIAWFFYMSLDVPVECEPCPDIAVVLWPQLPVDAGPQSDRPFRLVLPSGRDWYAGDGRYLLAQTKRLVGLRKMVGYRYRNRCGTGHGRRKIDAAVRRRTQQMQNVRMEFRRKLICDIVRQCERSQAGTIVYREPSGPVKEKCWFHRSDLEFDWTRFLSDLKNAAARRGIALNKKALNMAEVKKIETLDDV